jgi:hypothetical protein
MVDIIHDARSHMYFTMCCPSLILQKVKIFLVIWVFAAKEEEEAGSQTCAPN